MANLTLVGDDNATTRASFAGITGWDDAAIAEIVPHVAVSLPTNSVDTLAVTPPDVPVRHTGR